MSSAVKLVLFSFYVALNLAFVPYHHQRDEQMLRSPVINSAPIMWPLNVAPNPSSNRDYEAAMLKHLMELVFPTTNTDCDYEDSTERFAIINEANSPFIVLPNIDQIALEEHSSKETASETTATEKIMSAMRTPSEFIPTPITEQMATVMEALTIGGGKSLEECLNIILMTNEKLDASKIQMIKSWLQQIENETQSSHERKSLDQSSGYEPSNNYYDKDTFTEQIIDDTTGAIATESTDETTEEITEQYMEETSEQSTEKKTTEENTTTTTEETTTSTNAATTAVETTDATSEVVNRETTVVAKPINTIVSLPTKMETLAILLQKLSALQKKRRFQ